MNNSLSVFTHAVLRVTDLSHSFQEGQGSELQRVDVLQQVQLQVLEGESVAIVGASGSGKSTLLHLLGGLDKPMSGQIELMGSDLSLMDAETLGIWRNLYLGFIYQFHHLLPEFSALENVAMPLRIRRMNKYEAEEKAAQMLSDIGLKNRINHRPAELSGGERQRVAVARALVTNPVCVLADEPTGNLDRQTADLVFDLLMSRIASEKSSLVLVTHDARLAKRCSRQLELVNGQLV